MSLTLEDNGTQPIAKFGDESHISYIYLDAHPAEPPPQISILEEKLDKATIQELALSLSRGLTLNDLVSTLRESVPQSAYFRSFTIHPDEQMEPMPSVKSERVLNAGRAGCGKSTTVAIYSLNYLDTHPGNKVVIFCRTSDDPAFDHVPHREVAFDRETLEEQGKSEEDLLTEIQSLSLDELSNSLVVMDDMDNIPSKKLRTAAHLLMNDIMANGRKKNISIIYCSHLLLNYGQTRIALNEANKVFMYPGAGLRQIESFLKVYASMKQRDIEKITKLDSRWIMLSMNTPRYIVHEKGILLL